MIGTILTYAGAYVGAYWACVLGYKVATKGLSHTVKFVANGFSEDGISENEIGKVAVVNEKDLTKSDIKSDIELNKFFSDIIRVKEQKRVCKEIGLLINKGYSAKRIDFLNKVKEFLRLIDKNSKNGNKVKERFIAKINQFFTYIGFAEIKNYTVSSIDKEIEKENSRSPEDKVYTEIKQLSNGKKPIQRIDILNKSKEFFKIIDHPYDQVSIAYKINNVLAKKGFSKIKNWNCVNTIENDLDREIKNENKETKNANFLKKFNDSCISFKDAMRGSSLEGSSSFSVNIKDLFTGINDAEKCKEIGENEFKKLKSSGTKLKR